MPPEIVEAANECLPYVQLRATSQRESDQLLRASSADTLGQKQLLRPVVEPNNTSVHELLRELPEAGEL